MYFFSNSNALDHRAPDDVENAIVESVQPGFEKFAAAGRGTIDGQASYWRAQMISSHCRFSGARYPI